MQDLINTATVSWMVAASQEFSWVAVCYQSAFSSKSSGEGNDRATSKGVIAPHFKESVKY